jgi:uncharacterized Zn finger protein
MWYREFYPKSRPRAVQSGIRAQSKRGSFGTSWWAKRWIGVLEGFDIGARLGRGRSYARNGQVTGIAITEGRVRAKVQGSRPKPYDVTIQVKMLSDADWQGVVRALSGEALFAAKLLAGEMPTDIEKVFAEAGVSLFPERLDDLETACSCPDWSNPCKHIAAVYYLLGEEFDRDPFLLFRLRGCGREGLVRQLGPAAPQPAAPPDQAAPTPLEESGPLPPDPERFWAAARLPADFFGAVQLPPVAAAWPKRLGGFPFWRGEQPFLETLETAYRPAAQCGLDGVAGGRYCSGSRRFGEP